MNPVAAKIRRILPQCAINVIRWVRRKKRQFVRRVSALYFFCMQNLWPWFVYPDKKRLNIQIREIRYVWKKFGIFPREYFVYRHYRNGVDGKKLIPRNMLWLTRYEINDPDRELLQDKAAFRIVADAAGVKTVKELFSVHDSGEIITSSSKVISSDAAINLINEIEGRVFIKPLDGAKGASAYHCDKNTDFSFLFDGKNRWIVQPIIQQHQVLRDLYPNSINTLRIDTFTEDGNVKICTGFLRTGQGGSVVDNASQGGLTAPVDVNTGIVVGDGSQKVGFDPKQRKYPMHPDTRVAFRGLQLPNMNAVRENLIRVASAMPQYASVGWDIAFTTDGPIVLEGNYYWEMEIPQGYWPMGDHPLGEATYKRLGISPN